MTEKITFESAMTELEIIIKKLEDESLPLEDAINLHQRGIELNQFCQNELENAKLKIVEINQKES